MSALGYALFESPIGCCGVAWSDRGLVGVQLPEAHESETRARLVRRFPSAREMAPPRDVQRAIDGIVALFGGLAGDGVLAGVAVDFDGVPPFHRRVYEMVRTIPPGHSLSYGEVAALVGAPGAARAVGQAMAHNPFAIVVPCHRVVAAGGRVGGFSARGGVATKLRMVALEGTAAGGAE